MSSSIHPTDSSDTALLIESENGENSLLSITIDNNKGMF